MQIGWQRSIGSLFLVLILTPTLQAQRPVPTPSPIVDANNRFAFKLFKHLTTETPDHNILVAPTGLSLTFGLNRLSNSPAWISRRSTLASPLCGRK